MKVRIADREYQVMLRDCETDELFDFEWFFNDWKSPLNQKLKPTKAVTKK